MRKNGSRIFVRIDEVTVYFSGGWVLRIDNFS